MYRTNTGKELPLFSLPAPDPDADADADTPDADSDDSNDSSESYRNRRSNEKFARTVSGLEPLTRDSPGIWQGSMTVGTNAQPFTVQFETAVAGLFLPGKSCTSSGC